MICLNRDYFTEHIDNQLHLQPFFESSEDFFGKLRLCLSSHLSTLSEYFLLAEIQKFKVEISLNMRFAITVQSCLSRGRVRVDLFLTCVLHVHVLENVLVDNPTSKIVN